MTMTEIEYQSDIPATDILAALEDVAWDLDKFCTNRPDMNLWFANRYQIQFGIASDALIIDLATHSVVASAHSSTDSVVDVLREFLTDLSDAEYVASGQTLGQQLTWQDCPWDVAVDDVDCPF